MSLARPLIYLTCGIPINGMEMLKAVCEVKKWENNTKMPQEEVLKKEIGVDAILCRSQ